MKICFISEAKSIHTQRWVLGIAGRGDEVHLVSTSAAPLPGIVFHQKEIYDSNPYATLCNIRAIRKLIRTINPDILHVFGLYSINSIFTVPLVHGFSNIVLSPWGTDIVFDGMREPYRSRWIKKYLLSHAEMITSLSHFLTGEIKKYHSGRATVEHIPFGVDLELFKPCVIDKDPQTIIIGITKNFTLKYGHRYLFEAMPAVIHACPEYSLRLVVIGKGALEDELKLQVERLNISGNVTFLKHIADQKELYGHIKTFDLFVMPSIYKSETLGVAAIEAGASGIPVVASNIGGIPEVVEHMKTGILVEPGNSGHIARALVTLIKDKPLRMRMGAAARKMAEEKYDWDASIAKMRAVYRKIAMESQD